MGHTWIQRWEHIKGTPEEFWERFERVPIGRTYRSGQPAHKIQARTPQLSLLEAL